MEAVARLHRRRRPIVPPPAAALLPFFFFFALLLSNSAFPCGAGRSPPVVFEPSRLAAAVGSPSWEQAASRATRGRMSSQSSSTTGGTADPGSGKPDDDDAAAATGGDDDTEWGRAVESLKSASEREEGAFLLNSDEGQGADEAVDVAIVGGGLVGLAIAVGLSSSSSRLRRGITNGNGDLLPNDDDRPPGRRLSGRKITCRVYERAQQLRSNSQGMLAVQATGRNALMRLNPDICDEGIRKRSCEMRVRIGSQVIGNFVVDRATNLKDDPNHNSEKRLDLITWHHMQQALASLLPTQINDDNGSSSDLFDVKIKTGYSLAQIVEEEDFVVLLFKNGKRVRAKCVVGCDGTFSVTRQQIMKGSCGQISPIYFGQLNWASVVPTSKLPPNLIQPNSVRFLSCGGGGNGDEPAAGHRWTAFLNDAGLDQAFWQLRLVDPHKAMSLSKSKGRGGLGLVGVKDALLEVVSGSGCDDLEAAIRCTPESNIFERSIVALPTLSTWISQKSQRVALAGDAAHGMHPSPGFGANTGFEGAATIVEAMVKEVAIAATEAAEEKREKRKDDVDDGEGRSDSFIDSISWKRALTSYERLHKPRADIIQQYSNLMGIQQATGKAILSQSDAKRMQQWIVGSSQKKKTVGVEAAATSSEPDEQQRQLEPPADIIERLRDFNPWDYPGVSRLW